jgi:DNA-binding PadR family transcriptional regulator
VLKYLLLALLGDGPRHGYDLKGVFDELLGATWPLNIAQIYNALAKLEDEGMVSCEVVPQENVPNRKVYSLTAAGRRELEQWTHEPVEGPVRLRDEMFFKVLVGVELPGGAPLELIARQRQVYLQALADLTAAQEDPELALGTSMLLEGAALRLEADLRWLERCEERVRTTRGGARKGARPSGGGSR